LLRKDEFDQVLADYEHMGLNIKGVRAADQFYAALKGLEDPEAKRKAIGKTFIDVFDEESKKIEKALKDKWNIR
jgi:GMP synthase (glutamine-hydrolysing)